MSVIGLMIILKLNKDKFTITMQLKVAESFQSIDEHKYFKSCIVTEKTTNRREMYDEKGQAHG